VAKVIITLDDLEDAETININCEFNPSLNLNDPDIELTSSQALAFRMLKMANDETAPLDEPAEKEQLN
jgi:hypothetical protein